MSIERPLYDCDTSAYWAREEDYHDNQKQYGRFIDGGAAYEIDHRNTPRPWLNYLCNEKFASCISNTGLGFTWYQTSLLRITKYEHEIDYLPREFQDGREIILQDLESGETWHAFRESDQVRCVHRPGLSTITAELKGIRVTLEVFVPVEDSGECWIIKLTNTQSGTRRLKVWCGQTWTFSKFGIHTAEEGIPYLSIPGKDLEIETGTDSIVARSTNPELPYHLTGCFLSPGAENAETVDDIETRKDGRVFTFKVCRITHTIDLAPESDTELYVFSGADRPDDFPRRMLEKYANPEVFCLEKEKVLLERRELEQRISCEIPEKSIQIFLNVWLKNQLYLTFRFVRSGYFGFRDTLQDTWGYALLDPAISRRFLIRTLSHIRRDGVCPRNYSIVDEQHDLRAFMDSGSWIAQTLVDYIKETGDLQILEERIPWLDSSEKTPLLDHVWVAMDYLFSKRGRHGLCMTGDGDWNDALEGISRSGDAVSAWLTMAVYHAQNQMAELLEYIGDQERATLLRKRSEELKSCLNEHAWDGDWYVYGFTGSGKPIGSSKNREGRIHVNAQSWAIFTGIADEEKTARIRRAVAEMLDTKYGPALLAPPYVEEAAEVGRIARLEPGTFENGSIYMHAVAFKIYADFISGKGDEAVDLFARLLPTNPENFDARRTSEPYCTGNYYCGPTHERFGQNFFTWFTGNAAWLLRAGFDHMIGLKPGFDALHIDPCVPAHWNEFSATRVYRGQHYKFQFKRAEAEPFITVDGTRQSDMSIPAPRTSTGKEIEVVVNY